MSHIDLTLRRWLRLGAALLVATPVALSGISAEAAIVIAPGEELTRFEIDGDPIKDTHSGDVPENDFVSGDWGVGSPAAYGAMPGSGSIAPEEYATQGVQPLLWSEMVALDAPTPLADPPCPGEDDNWKGGKKVEDIVNIDDVSDLTDCGTVLNKGDLVRAYTAYEIVTVDDVDHTVIYGAWERGEYPGELYFYVPISDGVPGNTAGDRIIAFDYDSSSGMVSYRILHWTTEWVTLTAGSNSNVFQGAVGFADGDPFISGNPSFGEFALDLTGAGVLPPATQGSCLDYTTAGYVFTETGNSAGDPEPGEEPGNAQLKDYISATPLDLSNCAEVEVTKTVVGATDWSFDFTIAPVPTEEDGTKTATDENPTVSWGNIVAGEVYTISETAPAGWAAAALTCAGVTDMDENEEDNSVRFTAEAAQEISCSITNYKLGSITIDKVVVGPGDTDFDFTFGEASFTLSGADAPQVYGDLPAGTYSIEEVLPTPGFGFTSVTCTGADYTAAGASVEVDLDWGENATCTYTNTQAAQIVVDKVTVPSGSPQSFDFTLGQTPFSLTDAAQPWSSGPIAPNVPYTLTETLVDGWVVTGFACDNGVTSASNSAVLTPTPGQTITCTITNAQRGPVTIEKSSTGAVSQDGNGVYSVGYTITVSSDSQIDELFTLSDTPAFASGTTIQSMVVNGPGVTDLDLGGDGGVILTDATIPANGELVYTVEVTFSIGSTTTAFACGGSGTGAFNTATVVAHSGEDSDDACEPLPNADIEITKDAPAGTFGPGATFNWTLVVANNGPVTALDVVVTDQVPLTVVVNSVSSADFTCSHTGNSVTCTRPSLASGALGTITISVTVPANNQATSITNIGVVSTATPETDLTNNTDDATVPLVAQQPPPPPPPPVAELPATGASQVQNLAQAAAALIALGGLGLIASRRRRAAS